MTASLVQSSRQSPPIDISQPYDPAWVRGKTILITGGASGFGAGFVRKWASHDTCIVVGDVNTEAGDALVADIRAETGNGKIHFVHCDVASWDAQVQFFKTALKLSPHGGIDIVVANAGIAGVDPFLDPCADKNDPSQPRKPNLKIIDVNLTGVLYTTHLAFFHLPRNPGSQPASPTSDPSTTLRDRQLILVGSVASLGGLAGQPLYTTTKHAVLGLFRSARFTAFSHGVRINLLCPYFIETPLIIPGGRFLLAGGAMGQTEDVVDAGTRFAADSRINGRALVIGPKVWVKEKQPWVLAKEGDAGAVQRAVWEAYADELDDAELFCRRFVKILYLTEVARGWAGWLWDLLRIVAYSISLLWQAPAKPKKA